MIWLLSMSFLGVSLMLYCLGGQTDIWARRFVLPVLQSLLTLVIGFYLSTPWYVSLVPLLWIGVWHLGDSDHGWLGWLKKSWLICAVYGLVASVPVLVGAVLINRHLWELGAVVVISGAFVPDLPGTKIGNTKYSILWRDVLRISVVSACWLVVIIIK